MKWMIIFFLIPFSLYAQRSSPILKCLGAEEKELHLKKISGPRLDLNQKLIAEIIQIPEINIKSEFIESICQSKISPSLKLLEYSLLEEKNLFNHSKSIGLTDSINESMINEYIEATLEIFIQFVHQIQAIAPTSSCLEQQIPELKEVFINLKHAQEEIGIKKILNGKISTIFIKLIRFEDLIAKCQSRTKKTTK